MTQTTSFDPIIGRLDRLPGSLTPSILGLTPETAEQTIAAILEQIGEALEADGIALESFAENATASVEVQTWRRSRAGLVRKGSLALPVTVAGRRLCTLLIELDDATRTWPRGGGGRLQVLADWVGG